MFPAESESDPFLKTQPLTTIPKFIVRFGEFGLMNDREKSQKHRESKHTAQVQLSQRQRGQLWSAPFSSSSRPLAADTKKQKRDAKTIRGLQKVTRGGGAGKFQLRIISH